MTQPTQDALAAARDELANIFWHIRVNGFDDRVKRALVDNVNRYETVLAALSPPTDAARAEALAHIQPFMDAGKSQIRTMQLGGLLELHWEIIRAALVGDTLAAMFEKVRDLGYDVINLELKDDDGWQFSAYHHEETSLHGSGPTPLDALRVAIGKMEVMG